MTILAILIAAINVPVYLWVYANWKKDCMDIGKDNLAVSLKERIRATFLCITLPCILGVLMRKR